MASRAEHRQQTLMSLSSAATEAFEDLGIAATVEDIAERAGVSRRTVFRYVDAKEDLAYIHPMMWLDIFDAAVAEVPDLPVMDRVLHAAEQISLHIGRDPEPVRRAMAVAVAEPALVGRTRINQRWVARLAEEILLDTAAGGDRSNAEASFRAHVLGAATMGVIDASLEQWFTSAGDLDIADIVRKGLDYLAPIFER